MRVNIKTAILLGVVGLSLGVGVRAIARKQPSANPQEEPAASPQATGTSQSATATQAPASEDPIKTMVARLDLEKYKATIKGLTQFGDRRQGTDRNRAAIDWIEAQLKLYGCTNTERLKYDYEPPAPTAGRGGRRGGNAGGNPVAAGGGRPRGLRARTGVNNDPNAQPDPNSVNWIHSQARRASARKCTARKSERRIRTRCISSAAIWMESATGRRRMTTRQARLS